MPTRFTAGTGERMFLSRRRWNNWGDCNWAEVASLGAPDDVRRGGPSEAAWSGAPHRSSRATIAVVPSRVARRAEWTETILTDHFTFEPGDRALEHCWLDR